MKYTFDYPERFDSVNEARTWVERFTAYCNPVNRTGFDGDIDYPEG